MTCCSVRAGGAVGQMRVDRLIRELAHEIRLPVMLEARRHEPVEGTVQRRIGHLADVLRDDRGDVMERLECSLALLDGPGPAGHEGQERLAPALRASSV